MANQDDREFRSNWIHAQEKARIKADQDNKSALRKAEDKAKREYNYQYNMNKLTLKKKALGML